MQTVQSTVVGFDQVEGVTRQALDNGEAGGKVASFDLLTYFELMFSGHASLQ